MGNSVKIYERGRLLNLRGAQLKSYLSSLRGNEIKNLEILPQATAEYDAEGVLQFLLSIDRRSMSMEFRVMLVASMNGKAEILSQNILD